MAKAGSKKDKAKKGSNRGLTVAQELMIPHTQRYTRAIGDVVGKIARVDLDALVATDKDGKADHRVRFMGRDRIERSSGNEPARKVESKHEVEGTIYHDFTKRIEQGIEAAEDAIRNNDESGRKPKAKR